MENTTTLSAARLNALRTLLCQYYMGTYAPELKHLIPYYDVPLTTNQLYKPGDIISCEVTMHKDHGSYPFDMAAAITYKDGCSVIEYWRSKDINAWLD